MVHDLDRPALNANDEHQVFDMFYPAVHGLLHEGETSVASLLANVDFRAS